MAAVPITIVGTMTEGETTKQVTIMGLASLTGFGVGGGPILPDRPGDAHPEHPIVLPKPPDNIPPPSIWPPGPGIDWPEHPIVLPPPIDPGKPPEIPDGGLIVWKPVWTPDQGWMVIGVPNVPHPAPSKKK